MNADNIEISVLRDDEIEQINVFYNSIYKTDRSVAKFVWEFRQGPAQRGICVVAKDRNTGKIVGSQSAIPIDLITSLGQVVLSAKSEDTLVHPDYRGLSIFENMYKLLFAECEKIGIGYIWGFTYAIKPFTKLGFETPYNVAQSVMTWNVPGAARYLARYNRSRTTWTRTKMTGLSIFSRTITVFKNLSGAPKLVGIRAEAVERNAMDDNAALVGDIIAAPPGHFIIAEDMDYLAWRVVRNPYHDDIFNACFYTGNSKVAQVLFNHHLDGVWYIIQSIYSSSLAAGQRTAILKKAVAMLRESRRGNVTLIRTWDFLHNEINRQGVAAQVAAGFTPIRHGAVFVWKKLGNPVPLDPRHFILSRIASEGKI